MIKRFCDVCEKKVDKFENLYWYIKEAFSFTYLTDRIVCTKCKRKLVKALEDKIKEIKELEK